MAFPTMILPAFLFRIDLLGKEVLFVTITCFNSFDFTFDRLLIRFRKSLIQKTWPLDSTKQEETNQRRVLMMSEMTTVMRSFRNQVGLQPGKSNSGRRVSGYLSGNFPQKIAEKC
jgi:hypothetical protein